MGTEQNKIEKAIIDKALELGASTAGLASIKALKEAPSYQAYAKTPFYEQFDRDDPNYQEFKGFNWREEHKTALVWALEHPVSTPELDWWSMKVKGFTPGNGIMRMQSRKLRIWMEEEFGIKALSLPYQVEYGGAFLKDAAALAGLGVIGKNNLLVTPQFGIRVRLRGIFIEAELEPTSLSGFDPCRDCDMPCHRVCPQDAFRSGAFERKYCKKENDKREAETILVDGPIMGIEKPTKVSKPCRFCELACPVAQAG